MPETTQFDYKTTWEDARSVTVAESAPTTATDGIDVNGYDMLCVAVTDLSAVTDWDGQLYVYSGEAADSQAWAKANNADFDGQGANTFAEWFDVRGFERAEFVIDSLTGTSLNVRLRKG